MNKATRVIAVDWGSSNRRAYLIDRDGALLERREDGVGVLTGQAGDYAASLRALLGDWLEPAVPVWLSGMIGSRNGWQEVPYAPAPVALAELAHFAQQLPALPGSGALRILPGVCQRAPVGPADVMRGEETQLIGAWQLTGQDGWYVLPGTHSKWVRLEAGRIASFHTFMTGELFARLREKGALASVAATLSDDADAFLAGIDAVRHSPLAAALFSIRAGALLGEHPADTAASRLSGLLIGTEWHGAQQFGGLAERHVFLVGSPTLARWYRMAANAFGVDATVLDPDACYVRAIASLAGAQSQ